MTKKLVIYLDRPSGLALPQKKDADNIEYRKGLILKPGENGVDEDYWKFCKKNAAVKIYVKADILKDLGEGTPQPLHTPWNEITLAQAEPLIKQVFDVGELNKIKEKATKKGLVEMCVERIEELTKDELEDIE